MSGLNLPFAGSAWTQDAVFQVDCTGGGGAALRGRTGPDRGGNGAVAVEGHAVAGGVGLYGEGSGVDTTGTGGVGLWGVSDGGVGVFGRATRPGDSQGPSVGVAGAASRGVYGYGDDVGVFGESSTGLAMYANGDACQANDRGGWVKALVQVTSGRITRYFVAQRGLPPPVCYKLDAGLYSIDFQFPVHRRYATATAVPGDYSTPGGTNSGPNPLAPLWWPPPSGSVYQTKFILTNIVFDGLRAPPDAYTQPPGVRVPEPNMLTVMCFQAVQIGGGSPFVQGFQLKDAEVTVAVY